MPKFILNIPNFLTICRLFLVPLACIPLLPIFGSHTNFTLGLTTCTFLLAAVTDFLDGYLARKLNQISDWGVYMDPLIDKFLIWALFGVLIFIPFLTIPKWTFLMIFIRDIIVTEMRNYAIKNNFSFKTSFFAKTKTAIQLISGGIILLFLWISYIYANTKNIHDDYLRVWLPDYQWLYTLPKNLVIFTALLTGLTGIDYAKTLIIEIKKNKIPK